MARLLRLARIVSVGLRYRLHDLAPESPTRGQRLREALETLGPIFVKFGQVLSTRRDLLPLDIAQTHLVVEHEFPKARIQDRKRLKPILQASIGFVRAIDQAAACMFALQHEVLADQGIPAQGTGREPFRS